MMEFNLRDKSQSFDLMIELLFEMNCNLNVLNDLVSKIIAQGDEGKEDKINVLRGELFSSYRKVYLSILAEKFDLEISPE